MGGVGSGVGSGWGRSGVRVDVDEQLKGEGVRWGSSWWRGSGWIRTQCWG